MSTLAELRTELRSQLPAHPLIAALLTALTADLSQPRASEIAMGFVVNLTISVCIGFTAVTLHTVARRQVAPESPWQWPMLAFALAIAVVVGTELALLLLSAVFPVRDSLAIRFAIWRIGGIVSVVMGIVGVTYDRLRARAREVELSEQRAREQLLQARMENLQARLNPHFLFNSLNTVAALIEEDHARAVTAVEHLSDLLRYGLEGTRDSTVPLRRELGAVRDYLALERLRFGERLEVDIDIDEAAGDVFVPPLLLQPLVENAVKHGILGRHGGRVSIQAHLRDGALCLRVDDDGPGSSAADGTHTGEANLRERLRLAYGTAATFVTGPAPGGGYRAEIVVPSQTEASP